MDMSDVTVGVKTLYRRETLKRTLLALSKWNFNEIYVADDSNISDDKWDFYGDIKEDVSFKVLDLPNDTGVSYGRNRIIEKVDTKYFLLLDDDQVPYNLRLLKIILEENPNFGGVGGAWFQDGKLLCGGCNLVLKGNYLIKDVKDVEQDFIFGIPYWKLDMITTSALFRAKVFDDYMWDEEYKTGYEHVDFFLHHKLNMDWKFASCPVAVFGHYPKRDEKYKNERKSRDKLLHSRNHFLNKWDLKEVIKLKKKVFYNPSDFERLEIFLKRNLPIELSYLLERGRSWARKKFIMR